MPGSIERRDVNIEFPFSPKKEKQVRMCANPFIQVIANGLSLMYTSFFQLIVGCANFARRQYQHGINTVLNEKIGILFTKKDLAERVETIGESRDLQISTAHQKHQHELAALNYIWSIRVSQTISILRFNLNSFKLLFNTKKYQFDKQVSSEQISSFLDALQTLSRSLEEKNKEINTNEAFKGEAASQAIKTHIKEIFVQVHAIQPFLKEIGGQLVKKTPERFEFIERYKILVQHVNHQQKIHNNPSSDSYLNMLQEKEKGARLALSNVLNQVV